MPQLEIRDWLPLLVDLYYGKELSTRQIAFSLGISKTSVRRLLKKSGYLLRSPSEAMNLAWKEGRATPPRYERTPEIRQKISNGLKEYYSQHQNPWQGKTHTEEAKGKMSLARLGKHPSPETREKMRKINKARFSNSKSPMYGRHHTEESKRRMSEAHQGKTFSSQHKQKIGKAMKSNWQKPEYRAKVVPACLKSRRPTDLETKLIALIAHHNLPYKYTGDGSFTIGRLNPDFVNDNGDKIAIEVFGGHWHQKRGSTLRSEEGRRAILKEYGWKLIVIWGDEIKSMPEEAIVKRIENAHTD